MKTLFRLRADKTIYQILEATLRNLLFEQWDQIPALHMIQLDAEEIRERAEKLAIALDDVRARIVKGNSVIGGGSTPEQGLPTWLIAIESEHVTELERRLRTGNPPVVARIEDGRLLLDLRTVFPAEEPDLIQALRRASL